MCAHKLWDDPTGLVCTSTEPGPHGHRYEAAWAADGHDASEAEATR